MTECFWRCGDTAPEHEHYAVSVSRDGRWVGRLTPAGFTTRLKVHSAVLSKARAEEIASKINGGGSKHVAKVVTF